MFIAMTSLSRDSKTILFIEKIKALFKIEIVFWEDIQTVVCGNPALVQKYYPDFFNGLIPVGEQNLLISTAFTLKKIAEGFNQNYKDYRVAYQYNDDVAIYNQCVEMAISVSELYRLHDLWYVQLKNKKIIKPIEKLIESMPAFHDENNDGSGGSMVYTITNFLTFFSDDERVGQSMGRCDKIITRAQK